MTEDTRTALADTLPKIRDRISRLKERKETVGEQNTRAVLIDPLLSTLGWELENPDEVFREYKSAAQDNPVDYALSILRSPRLFVEAKSIGKDLKDRRWVSQVLGYATVVGVEWCVLTDGDEYRLYNAHAAVDVEQKLFRSVRISDAAQEGYTLDTLELLSKEKVEEDLISVFWRASFTDHRVKTALEELFKDTDNGLVRLIRKRSPDLDPSEIRQSIERADIKIEFPEGISQPTTAKTPPKGGSPSPTKPAGGKGSRTQVIDLINAGFITPPFALEKVYKGVHLKATIQRDGSIEFGGEYYSSLSIAAGMARNSVIGTSSDGSDYHPTNGWTFWKYRDSTTGRLEEVDRLRKQYLGEGSS